MTRALKWWIALALVVVFCAGLATGFFGAAFHLHRSFTPHRGPQRMLEHLQDELELTPEQAAQINPIIEKLTRQLDAIRAETGQRVAQTMEESHREMQPLLTPEQRTRLEKMRQRHEQMLQRRKGPPPPPPAP